MHGWDIAIAGGSDRPCPPGLASDLLPIAALLISPGRRAGCSPTRLRCRGGHAPVTKSAAFLGRQPRIPAAPGPS